MFARLFCWIMASALLISAPRALAEDGYDLWLRNAPADAAAAQQIGANARSIVGGASPTLMIAEKAARWIVQSNKRMPSA